MTTPTQPDLFTGEEAKEQGTQRVLNHNQDWHEAVMQLIQKWADTGSEFTIDNIRVSAVFENVPEPTHPNAWGAAMTTASKEKRIRHVGYRKSESPSAHARVIAVWVGTGLPF